MPGHRSNLNLRLKSELLDGLFQDDPLGPVTADDEFDADAVEFLEAQPFVKVETAKD